MITQRREREIKLKNSFFFIKIILALHHPHDVWMLSSSICYYSRKHSKEIFNTFISHIRIELFGHKKSYFPIRKSTKGFNPHESGSIYLSNSLHVLALPYNLSPSISEHNDLILKGTETNHQTSNNLLRVQNYPNLGTKIGWTLHLPPCHAVYKHLRW